MKKFWVKFEDKEKFFLYVANNSLLAHIAEIDDPFFRLNSDLTIEKFYKYCVDIDDESFLALKLMFDLREEV